MQVGRQVGAGIAGLSLAVLAGASSAPPAAGPTRWSPWVAVGRTGPGLAHRPASIVVLGDSVAAGTGCDCDAFGVLLARRVGTPVSLHRHARDGLTARQLGADLAERRAGLAKDLLAADIVTVTIGANDFDAAGADNGSCKDADCFADDLAALRTSLPTARRTGQPMASTSRASPRSRCRRGSCASW